MHEIHEEPVEDVDEEHMEFQFFQGLKHNY